MVHKTGKLKFRDVIDDVIEIKTPSGVLIKVRIVFIDGSFLDIYWSDSERYSLNYERRHIDGGVYGMTTLHTISIDIWSHSPDTFTTAMRGK